MAKIKFEIAHPDKDRIEIEADDGFVIDDWRELTSATCLIMSGGFFKRHPDRTVFSSSGSALFIFNGDPFGTDSQGSATLELPDNGCPGDGWTWRRL